MPRVYTYFEDLPGIFAGERELLDLCRQSWEQHGWDFHVLTRQDAEKHSQFKAIQDNDHLVTGARNKAAADWERCSYYRWLALAEAPHPGPGLLIDYDMINYGLKSSRQLMDPGAYMTSMDMVNYHQRGQFSFDASRRLRPPTPCLAMSSGYLKHMIDWLADYRTTEALEDQCTDQLILHYYGNRIGGGCRIIDGPSLWCTMYSAPDWREALVVHYTHWSIAQGHTANRADFIQLERPI